jgi:hypothetical protein
MTELTNSYTILVYNMIEHNVTGRMGIKMEQVTFEAFTEAMFQVEIFWVVTPCSVAVGYQRFGDPTPSIFRAKYTSYPTTTLHGVTTRKTST